MQDRPEATNMSHPAPARRLFTIAGADRITFLQGLVTNDVARPKSDLVYAALLSAQGKYLADFFLLIRPDHVILDADAGQADGLVRRLSMYKLRADVTITPSKDVVVCGLGTPPAGAARDPRDAALGWRYYGPADTAPAPQDVDWDALNVTYLIPQSGIELVSDDSYILEMGFERLNGVDFRKGCYVGQEVTARMKHKTELRKGLVRVALDQPVPPGTPITAVAADGSQRDAGTVYTQSGGRGLAFMRLDRATGTLVAGGAKLRLDPQD